MFTKDIEIEYNEYHGPDCTEKEFSPTMMHLNHVISESLNGSDDAARDSLEEIYVGTLHRAFASVLNWPFCDKSKMIFELRDYANYYIELLNRLHIRSNKEEAKSFLMYIQSLIDEETDFSEVRPLYQYHQIVYNIDKRKPESISKISPTDFDTAMTQILEEENKYFYPLLIMLLMYAKKYYIYCDKNGIKYDQAEKVEILQKIESEMLKMGAIY